MSDPRILVLNPGSTSTKVALFEGPREIFRQTVEHPADELAGLDLFDQLPLRRRAVEAALAAAGVDLERLDAVAARGGILPPLRSGVYRVTEGMLAALRNAPLKHASNLGAYLARELADPRGIPAFVVDPVSVDEFEDVARITGLPGIYRRSFLHALNLKAVARRLADELGRPYEALNLIGIHLGGGISVCAHRRGRIVDSTNAVDEGPFSPQRAGTLPMGPFLELVLSGKHSEKELWGFLLGRGGWVAHLGTQDAREVEARIRAGDRKALLVARAMAYQVAKAAGGMAAVLRGQVDALYLTGGLARWERLVAWLREDLAWIAPIHVFPGEGEMEALAAGALRALRGETPVLTLETGRLPPFRL